MGSDVRRNSSETRSVHEAFVELVQHDDDLMRAEFDALIDACWHWPPPPPPARPQPVPRPPLWPVGPLVDDLFVPLDAAPEGARWRRQRAPPATRDVSTRSMEGR
ncbi:hypothetical protein ACFP2T_11505 [Plantactinospora solaniradicis]|uniref:Uncharacterized protein n=1 Tax=Plantactinospora solaniradicis TaxID=1723736 RepID=A0ABW1K5T8_9ACTN